MTRDDITRRAVKAINDLDYEARKPIWELNPALQAIIQRAIDEATAATDRSYGQLAVTSAKLQAFKDFVHRRLDEAGIPTHPDGPHSKEGCRIGDRLDIALAARGDAHDNNSNVTVQSGVSDAEPVAYRTRTSNITWHYGESPAADGTSEPLYAAPQVRGDAEPVSCNPSEYCVANHLKLYAHPAKPQGERVLLARIPNSKLDAERIWREQQSGARFPGVQYRYASLDSEEA